MLCIYYPLSGFRTEATFGLPYSIELTRKAKERTGGPNFTLRTLNNAKPYFFLNEMNTKDLCIGQIEASTCPRPPPPPGI